MNIYIYCISRNIASRNRTSLRRCNKSIIDDVTSVETQLTAVCTNCRCNATGLFCRCYNKKISRYKVSNWCTDYFTNPRGPLLQITPLLFLRLNFSSETISTLKADILENITPITQAES